VIAAAARRIGEKSWGSVMRCWNKFLVALAAGILAGATPAPGQAPAPDIAAAKTLTDAANALGMVRGVERSLSIVNMFEYTASGTLAEPSGAAQVKVTRVTAGYDYVIPAARVDVETTGLDGHARRTIEVAAGPLAWDESTPGVYLRPAATPAAERLRQIWLLPHGVILAGAKAPDKVRVVDQGGLKALNVTLPDGTEVSGLLDANNLMTHIELKIGGRVLSADFAGYNDFQGYGVMFPSHIVQKVDGQTVADLTVTEALANPYLIFPPPKELGQR
jgi:hypothetical protein